MCRKDTVTVAGFECLLHLITTVFKGVHGPCQLKSVIQHCSLSLNQTTDALRPSRRPSVHRRQEPSILRL
eukprot:14153351-Alexandrium_andersonii.AAC.1